MVNIFKKFQFTIKNLSDGWATIQLQFDDVTFEWDIADSPVDSFKLLVESLDKLNTGEINKAIVTWILEPLELEFELKKTANDLKFEIIKSDVGMIGEFIGSFDVVYNSITDEINSATTKFDTGYPNWSWPFPELEKETKK